MLSLRSELFSVKSAESHTNASKAVASRFKRTATNWRLVVAFALAILVPALLASLLVWQMMVKQINTGYEQRLNAELELFHLLIRGRGQDLQRIASRIAADNTVQVTMELEIVPQLRRYLRTQGKVSGVDFLFVFSADGRQLAGLGEGLESQPHDNLCDQQEATSHYEMFMTPRGLYLVQTMPVRKGMRYLGTVCTGLSLSSGFFNEQLRSTIGGIPLICWQQDCLAPRGSMNFSIHTEVEPHKMFDRTIAENRFKGMTEEVRLGSDILTIGIMLPLTTLEKGFRNLLWSLLLVLGLITLIAVGAWRFRSNQLKAEDRLTQEQERAMVTLSSLGDGIVTTSDLGFVNYINPAAEHLLGYPQEKVLGRPYGEIINLQDEKTGETLPNPIDEILDGKISLHAPADTMLMGADGKQTAVHYSATAIPGLDGEKEGVVLALRDVSRERGLQRSLAWKASRDDLTGLINRTEFRTRVEEAIEHSNERGSVHGLLYLDLDQFKVVNDSCGHQAGDDLLKQLTTLLNNRLRSADTLARLGGDEFGALLMDCPSDQVMAIADELRESVKEHRFLHKDKIFQIGVSIGVVIIDSQSADLDSLMSAVDAACYTAKDQGRNCIHLFQENGGETGRRITEMQWVPRIRQALKEDRFELYYQPIVSIDNEMSIDAGHGEILIRMLDEEGGMVPPGAFLPVAERYDLISDIDRWTIRTLFTHHKDRYRNISAEQITGFPFSINLSGASLMNPAFLEFVKSEIRTQEIPPEMVAFEITETAAISHLEKATYFIAELKRMGCKFLLDDFGSGMSSFGYLKHLPVDYLKIDGLFVKDIVNDPIDHAMVSAINQIGHTMGLKTVAEYVENREIFQELKTIGVDFAQGYGIAPPGPLNGR